MKYRIAHFTDWHLSPLNHIPQSRTSYYHTDTAEEIKNLKESLKQEKAETLVFSGDMFHLKNQAAYSPKDLNYYCEVLRDFPLFFSIPGNHDLPKSSIANMKDSPYSNLLNSLPQVMCDISFPKFIKIDLPFQTFKEFYLFGIPYLPVPALKDFLKELPSKFPFADKKDALFGFLVHVDATPQSMLVNLWESFNYQELTDLFPSNSILFLGHIHASFPPFHNTTKNVFTSKPWSMGRVIKDYFNQTDVLTHLHTPSYSVVTMDETEEGFRIYIEYKNVAGFKPATEIFDMPSLKVQLEKSKDIQNKIQGWKNEIDAAKGNPFFLSDPMLYLQGLKMEKEVFDIITEYLNK